MGLSYTILPTSELSLEDKFKRKTFIEHFSAIESYFFPEDWNIDTNSSYPTNDELKQAMKNGEMQYVVNSEEEKENGRTQLSFDISHKENKYNSDFTIEHENNQIKSMHGIKGDFNILLRLTSQLTELKGSMIIFSAYDSYYIEPGKTYSQIWNMLKDKWAGEE